MKQRLMIAVLLTFALIAQCVSQHTRATQAAAAPIYTVIDLGALGGSFASAFGINKFGQVAGYSTLVGDPIGPSGFPITHTFLYSGGQMTDIGTLGGSFSFPAGINDFGQIAGTSLLTGDPIDPVLGVPTVHAFRYSGGNLSDLGTLGGSYSNAAGINNSGQVCGVSPLANGENRGFLYSNGVMNDIGTLGGRISFANGINNNGLVVGQAGITGNSAGHAFIYNSATGARTDLGTLGGFNSQAIAINDAGQVVGDSWLTGNPLSPDGSPISHAFLYNSGNLTDLGVLPGDLSSSASGINAAGQVIGVSYNSSSQRPFLYSNGMMQDLNTLILPSPGWQITGATAINDAGQIVGGGTINGQQRAVLLTTPSQLIGNLANLVQSFSIRPGIRILLLIELRAASAFANAGNVARACNLLNSFIILVNAQSGRSISPTDASQLLAPARQARAALGCP